MYIRPESYSMSLISIIFSASLLCPFKCCQAMYFGVVSSLDIFKLKFCMHLLFSYAYHMLCPSRYLNFSNLYLHITIGQITWQVVITGIGQLNEMLIAGFPGDSTKLSSNAADVLSVDQLAAELGSVALDWKTLRNIRECICSTPFDHFSRKVRFFILFYRWYPYFYTPWIQSLKNHMSTLSKIVFVHPPIPLENISIVCPVLSFQALTWPTRVGGQIGCSVKNRMRLHTFTKCTLDLLRL